MTDELSVRLADPDRDADAIAAIYRPAVEETTDRYILVKTGLVNACHHYQPAATLAHVRPELKEIGISLTAEQVAEGDWSEPPAEGPRSEGAPLNLDNDEEVDAVMKNQATIEPERPPVI